MCPSVRLAAIPQGALATNSRTASKALTRGQSRDCTTPASYTRSLRASRSNRQEDQRRVEASRNDHHVWSKGAGDWHDDLFKGRDIFGISHEPIAPPDVDLSPETKGERGNRSNPASHERETVQEGQREEERREMWVE